MNVFELAAVVSVVQAGLWLLLEVVKTLARIRRMVKEKRKPGSHSNDDRA